MSCPVVMTGVTAARVAVFCRAVGSRDWAAADGRGKERLGESHPAARRLLRATLGVGAVVARRLRDRGSATIWVLRARRSCSYLRLVVAIRAAAALARARGRDCR